jgi:antitoxin ParD1/3/4
MPTSFALSPHFETFIRDQVEGGRFNNGSEVVCAGLRLREDTEPPAAKASGSALAADPL